MKRRSGRKAKGKTAAKFLVTPVAVAGVLIYGPALGSADGAPESPLPSTISASRVPLRAQAAGPLPEAWTGRAIFPTSTNAILTGQINARGEPTRFKFQYGLTKPYAHTSEVGEQEVRGHITNDVAESISQLKPGTTYHFRIIAFNKYGFVTGKDRTFTTLKR